MTPNEIVIGLRDEANGHWMMARAVGFTTEDRTGHAKVAILLEQAIELIERNMPRAVDRAA